MNRGLPPAAYVYIWTVAASAVVFTAGWVHTWRGDSPATLSATLLLILLFALGVAAIQLPLEIAPKYNVNLITAVQFAGLLLFGPPLAMGLISGSALVGSVILRLRHVLTGSRTRRNWRTILFNTAQWTIATGVGGVVYYSLLPHEVPAPQNRLENLWAVPGAAAAMFLTNTWLVAVIAGMQLRQSPVEIWLSTRRREVLHEAGLFLLGLIAARTAQNDPWIPLVMVLPTAIIYLSTKRNVQLVEQTIAAVEALADTVDQRDPYTFQHSKRVADYSQRIARAMRLPADEVEKIRLAARVHDLGKIGVPNEVLHKQGALTDDEWQVMRRHPEMGYEILAKFPEYREGRELVLAHHERYDGKGYPSGLDGDHMRLGAQIIAVADTLDAMTSDRPYRKALPMETALAELHRGRGTQFNPLVVDTLARLLAQDAHQQTPRLVPSAVSAA